MANWLTRQQIEDLKKRIEARKRFNTQTVLPIYSLNEDGEYRETPLPILRSMNPTQLVHNEWGEIMTVKKYLDKKDQGGQ